MVTVKLTEDEWYARECERVLRALHAHLPHEGLPAAELKHYLENSGFSHTDEEWQEITRRLRTQGKIQLL